MNNRTKIVSSLILLAGFTPALANVAAEAEEATPKLFTLDPGLAIWAILTFGALLVLLRTFAWGPIIHSIDERDKQLRESMESAEEARNESRKIAEEQKKILSESREEGAKIISDARKASEDYRKKIEATAQEERVRILSGAQADIQTAREEAIAEIRNVAADLAINAAGKLLEQNLDDEKSRQLVHNYIEKVEP